MAALLNGQEFLLTYLFEAHFEDGSIIRQTHDDRSTIYPETKSAFYDVLQKNCDLAFFGLYDGKNTFVVDLRDGHFEINGVPFSAQPVLAPIIPAGGKFKLVYYRDHQQDFVLNESGDQKPGEHRVAYRFGWEYTIAHKTYFQTIVIS